MTKFKDAQEFIFERGFKVTYLNNKLDVVNYTDITHFDNNKIIINYKEGSIFISGSNLFISKLLSDELLIEGSIEKIELR